MSLNVRLYTRRGCHLCDDVHSLIEAVRDEFEFALQIIDIDSDPILQSDFGCSIPVVTINGGNRVALRVNEERLRRALSQAQQREAQQREAQRNAHAPQSTLGS